MTNWLHCSLGSSGQSSCSEVQLVTVAGTPYPCCHPGAAGPAAGYPRKADPGFGPQVQSLAYCLLGWYGATCDQDHHIQLSHRCWGCGAWSSCLRSEHLTNGATSPGGHHLLCGPHDLTQAELCLQVHKAPHGPSDKSSSSRGFNPSPFSKTESSSRGPQCSPGCRGAPTHQTPKCCFLAREGPTAKPWGRLLKARMAGLVPGGKSLRP